MLQDEFGQMLERAQAQRHALLEQVARHEQEALRLRTAAVECDGQIGLLRSLIARTEAEREASAGPTDPPVSPLPPDDEAGQATGDETTEPTALRSLKPPPSRSQVRG